MMAGYAAAAALSLTCAAAGRAAAAAGIHREHFGSAASVGGGGSGDGNESSDIITSSSGASTSAAAASSPASWMVLPPYPHQYHPAAAAAAAMAAGGLHHHHHHHHAAAAALAGHHHHPDYSALTSSLQQGSGSGSSGSQQQHHRRSPLSSSSAAYTHSCILEMRKEKSRDAARSRRGKENYEFYELAKMLPLPPAITSQLDKASIIRLTISFLRLKEFSSNGDPPWVKELQHLSSSSSNGNGGSSSPPSAAGATGSSNSSSASSSTSSSNGGGSSTKATKGGRSSRQQQPPLNHHHQQPLSHHHPHHHHQQQVVQQQHGNYVNPGLPGASIHVELFDQHIGTHILQSLDGFAFSLGSDGRFLYISETVSIYLGLSQVEMTGSSIFDYVHSADHAELAQQLGLTLASSSGSNPGQSGGGASSAQLPPSPASGTGSVEDGNSSMNPDVTSLMSLESNAAYQGLDRSFCIRMKSTLTKRGCHFKSSGYRVVMVLCRLRPSAKMPPTNPPPPGQPIPLLGMIAMAIALPPPTVHEVRLEPDMFVTRLSFDLRIVHCEPRIAELLEFVAEDLTGRSLYALCHAEDVRLLRKAHTDLMHKGQVMTPYYRILNRNGGFTWLQSCATVVCNSKSGDEQSIVCVNYVLSRTEMKTLVVDQCQLDSAPPAPPLLPMKSAGFKMMGSRSGAGSSAAAPRPSSSADLLPGESPSGESGGSEDCAEPSPRHVKSAESRPSSGEAHQDAASESGRTATRGGGGRPTGSKRKYGDLSAASTTPTDGSDQHEQQSGMLDGQPHHHHHNQPDSLEQQQADQEAQEAARNWKRLYSGAIMDQQGSESVQQLSMQDRADLVEGNGAATDFSADALVGGNKQRPTIQWIGGAAPTSPTSSGGAIAATTSASTTAAAAAAAALSVPSLLRQLYASRESVIRANVHAAAAAAAAGRSASGYHFSNGDSSPMAGVGNGSGPGVDYPTDVFPPTTAYHAAAAAAAGTFLPEYLPAMTPPSSVSPRDAAAGALFAASAEASLRHYGAEPAYVATALKPHHHHHHSVYGHAGSIDHHHHQSGGGHGHQPYGHHQVSGDSTGAAAQFYHHHHHHAASAGFHLYHPQAVGSNSSSGGPSSKVVASSSSSSSAGSSSGNNNNNNSATWYPN